MLKEVISFGIFLALSALSVYCLMLLRRWKGRINRAAAIIAIAAAYLGLTYLISLWASMGGWPEGMFYMMVVVFIVPPMMVGMAVFLILTLFGGETGGVRRVGMISSFVVLILVIMALVFNRQIRALWYSEHLDSPDPQTRSYAVLMLGGTRVHMAAPTIIRAAGDKDPTVRKNAIIALLTLDDPANLPVVRAALDDEDAGVRKAAVIAILPLGRGGPEVVADLKRMLADPEPSVRMVAANGLDTIDPQWRGRPDTPEEFRLP